MTTEKDQKQLVFEQQAFPHADVLYRFGLSLTRNAADAEDLVQDTYLKAYRFWDSYDPGTNTRAWLFRILKNSFINVYRKKSKEPAMVDYCDTLRPAMGHEIPSDAESHQTHELSTILDDDVFRAMTGLTEEFRTVLVLCDIEELTYEEIARRIGCPLGTVRSRIHRGRKVLHSRLYEYARSRGYVGVDGIAGEGDSKDDPAVSAKRKRPTVQHQPDAVFAQSAVTRAS